MPNGAGAAGAAFPLAPGVPPRLSCGRRNLTPLDAARAGRPSFPGAGGSILAMSAGATAYLVVRRDDGFGDVFPLTPGQTCSLGRAASNRIVLKDDLCSREHAEVSAADGRWRVRDLNSLNGTRLNGVAFEGERELAPNDEVQVGRTCFLFVEDMGQLPDLPNRDDRPDGVSIKKRLGQTRFLTPVPPAPAAAEGVTSAGAPSRHALSRDLSLLYRLALDMASAVTYDELCRIVLDALLEAIPAEVGAILTTAPDVSGDGAGAGPTAGRGAELEVTAHRHRDPSVRSYTRVSEYVSNEVLAGREAILAEDVARDRHLRNRESLSELGATSLICAPVIHGGRVQGLIHLYCTDPHRALDAEDLEFAVAVAKQLGAAVHQLRLQQSLSAENRSLKDQLHVESELVGSSPAVRELESRIGRVAGTNACCLIRGESGAGKELVARAVHYSSPRKDGPFICLNCAALTETLLESELFGHEKGSFTGATEKKVGKFEAAHRGTIFLDEIGEMAVGRRRSCCACWRATRSSGSGAARPSRWTCAWWRPRISRWRRRCARAGSAATCSSVCRWWRSACRRSASARATCRCWRSTFYGGSCARRAGGSAASRRRRWRRWRSTTGRATSASCGTWWSGRWRWAWDRCSTWVTSGCHRWRRRCRPRRPGRRRTSPCRWRRWRNSTSCGR